MTRVTDAAAVRRIPLFRDFGEREIADIAAATTYRSYHRHEFIMREGEAGGTFFILMQGSVSVCRLLPDGREMILAILEEGDFFGEMANQDVRMRLASLLLNLPAELGEPTNGGTRIALLLASQDIANIIATTADTVNRTLKKLRDDDVIELRASRRNAATASRSFG